MAYLTQSLFLLYRLGTELKYTFKTFQFWKAPKRAWLSKMCLIYHISKIFSLASNITLSNSRKGLVKVTFPSPLQYLNDFLSKYFSSLKFEFSAVGSMFMRFTDVVDLNFIFYIFPLQQDQSYSFGAGHISSHLGLWKKGSDKD